MSGIEEKKINDFLRYSNVTPPPMFGIKKHLAMLWDNENFNIIGQLFENMPGMHAEVGLKNYINSKKSSEIKKNRKTKNNRSKLYFIVIGLQYDYTLGMSMPCIGCVRTLCKLLSKNLDVFVMYSLLRGKMSQWMDIRSLIHISIPSSIICF